MCCLCVVSLPCIEFRSVDLISQLTHIHAPISLASAFLLSFPFHQPIDAEELGIPEYHDVIARPMDLATLRKNIVSRRYHRLSLFVSDVRLIWRNCLDFNETNSEVCACVGFWRETHGFCASLSFVFISHILFIVVSFWGAILEHCRCAISPPS